MLRALDDPDTAAVLAEVERFAARAVAQATPAPGQAMAAPALASLLDAARGLGLVATPGEPTELALWDDAGAARGPARSVRVLARLARAHAGVALALHREALGAWLARDLGVAPGRVVATVQGRFGLARTSLARYLAGAALDATDEALLGDVFGDGPRLATAHGDFAAVLAPRWHGGALGWACVARAELDASERPHTHGFEELTTLAFRVRAAPLAGGGDARARMSRALVLDGLGLLAIARGAAARAVAAAASHASARRQGGVVIEHHAAVQQLLASGRAALHVVDALLADAAAAPAGEATLGPTLAARAEGHVLLARATNDAVQVLGGLGYMREAGLEKALRDVNHLRAVGGSPPELALFLDTWERLRG